MMQKHYELLAEALIARVHTLQSAHGAHTSLDPVSTSSTAHDHAPTKDPVTATAAAGGFRPPYSLRFVRCIYRLFSSPHPPLSHFVPILSLHCMPIPVLLSSYVMGCGATLLSAELVGLTMHNAHCSIRAACCSAHLVSSRHAGGAEDEFSDGQEEEHGQNNEKQVPLAPPVGNPGRGRPFVVILCNKGRCFSLGGVRASLTLTLSSLRRRRGYRGGRSLLANAREERAL